MNTHAQVKIMFPTRNVTISILTREHYNHYNYYLMIMQCII